MQEEIPPDIAELDKPGLEALLAYLDRERGFDFTGYKHASLSRRIQVRMDLLSVKTYGEYVDYLQVRPDEFQQLFNSILINVTGFFRDPSAWEGLREQIERLLADREGKGVRVWCAGCASGEEAYTLAMVLCDALGPAEVARRVKIYATDIDDEALAQARTAEYSQKSVDGLPPGILDRYFTRNAGVYTFSKDLRRAVIFGRHDLVHDAPISRVDILTCRNTLMYLNSETQLRVLNRLNFALADDGVLLLGKAEMLLTHASLFTPIDLKQRLFKRAYGGKLRDRSVSGSMPAEGAPAEEGASTRLQRAVFDASPVASIVIDEKGRLALANLRAASLFSLTAQDIGRPFQDLELSYRPAELRSRIDSVRAENTTFQLRAVERVAPNGDKTFLDVSLTPIQALGVQVDFFDVTETQRLRHDLGKANAELDVAHAELQSASEELETTNEELQSTVEELETTNEELQSTNEELETMNEELQSTNEELQTMNGELRTRGTEFNKVNAFFASILASLRSGVAVLDGELLVKAWNPRMEDLWGLRAEEVEDRHFSNLDIGLPVAELAVAIRACVAAGTEDHLTVTATSRRGRTIQCRVTISPMRVDGVRGVIVLVEEIAIGT